MSATSSSSSSAAAGRSIATWLSVLFAMLIALIAVGGYVRLSGSGLSIPDWPIIKVGDSWSLLPPFREADWGAVRERYDVDQVHLQSKVADGAVGMGSLGLNPTSMGEFKTMFLIEWTHRFVAGLLGLVAVSCLTVAVRHADLRRRVAPMVGTIVGLIVFQAILGGMLVKSGTATHWLFLHLGTAAVILSLIVWTILRALDVGSVVGNEVVAARSKLIRISKLTYGMVWTQIVLGALVAGSRASGHHGEGIESLSKTWPKMYGYFIPPDLWVSTQSIAWNLLDNPSLHQWTHRWFALIVLVHLGLVFMRARRTEIGPRTRLALHMTAMFLGVQIMLGLANVFMGAPTLVALAHLLTANMILATLMLTIYDLRHEPNHVGDEELSAAAGKAVSA